MTDREKELVKELLDMDKADLYPRGLQEPNWGLIERFKEIKKELEL